MSALGDYVHLYRRNYIKYGVGRPSYGQVKRFQGTKDTFLAKRLSGIPSIDDATVTKMGDILRANTLARQRQDQMRSQLDFQQQLDYLYEFMAKHTTTDLLGRYQGGAYNKGNGSGWAYNEAANKWAGQGNKKVKGLTPDQIKQKKHRLANFNEKISQINKRGTAKKEELKFLEHEYRAIIGQPSGPITMSMLGQLQQEANAFTFYSDISNLVGAMGEGIVALCDDTVQGMAKEEVENHLRQAVQGNQQTSFIVNQSQVHGNLKTIGMTTAEGSSMHVAQSKDKVDVHIKVNGQDVFANVKHYWDPASISLQEESRLMYSLIYLDTLDKIGTHWLNIHAAGTHNTASPMYSGPAAELNEILRYELAYEALVSGNPLKQGASSANVFTFLNRATGQVYIKSARDVLLEDFDRFVFDKDLDSMHFDNQRAETADGRIENLLQQIHQVTFKVSFKIGGKFSYQ